MKIKIKQLQKNDLLVILDYLLDNKADTVNFVLAYEQNTDLFLKIDESLVYLSAFQIQQMQRRMKSFKLLAERHIIYLYVITS